MGRKTLIALGVVFASALAVSQVEAMQGRPKATTKEASAREDARETIPRSSLAPSTRESTNPRITVRSEDEAPNAYAIGIGDVLEITVWKNQELGVTVPVRPDGRISVPLLGDIQAAGMTPLALKETLTQGFREYITAPEVAVVIKEINSRKVFVTGEVATPGAYDLQPRTKLMQVLAMAGGTTPYAKKRVIILRDRDGRDDRRYEIDIDGITSGRRPADNMVLLPGDTIIVP